MREFWNSSARISMLVVGRFWRQLQIALALSIVLIMASTFLTKLPTMGVPSSITASNGQQLWQGREEPVKVAHVVSLIICEKEKRVTGLLDALAILRHSIHQNSVHAGKSAYSYQMVAIVHEKSSCTKHLPLLGRLGYEVLLRDTPVNVSSIPNDWYRSHVENENCCGSAEFIKLYAYTLVKYPIFVHWDLDTAVLQPMDVLFDSMLHPATSQRGSAARSQLKIQNPSFQTLPDRIDAFFTRDVTSAKPWETVRAVQGGFLVARPNMEHFSRYQQFITEGNYSPGRGPNSGWGGLGYGGFQGAMAYQGVLAYFYDQIYKGHSVELDVCRWNQVVADVIWRGPERIEQDGQCRQHPVAGVSNTENTPENGQCEDCRVLPVEDTMTVHFTACKKPWDCLLPRPRKPGPKMKAHTYRLRQLTNVTTCSNLFRSYFGYRRGLELQLSDDLGIERDAHKGTFSPDIFMGYCDENRRYIPINIPPHVSLKQMYGF